MKNRRNRSSRGGNDRSGGLSNLQAEEKSRRRKRITWRRRRKSRGNRYDYCVYRTTGSGRRI